MRADRKRGNEFISSNSSRGSMLSRHQQIIPNEARNRKRYLATCQHQKGMMQMTNLELLTRLFAFHTDMGMSSHDTAFAVGGLFIGMELVIRHPEYAAALRQAEPYIPGKPDAWELADDLVDKIPIAIEQEIREKGDAHA